MKKVMVPGKKIAMPSYEQVRFVYPEQERDYSASSSPTGTFIIPNRLKVEEGKNLPVSGSQITSKDILVVYDFGNESFYLRTASSQTDVAKFRETRLITPMEIRRRTKEAFDRSEQKRKELAQQEAILEGESEER